MKPPAYPVRCSVIIPVFDGWEVTQRCLESIRATTPEGAAGIIVIDNASLDATPVELTRRAAEGRLKVVRNERNESYAHANNQGAALSAAPILVFLNNDTVLLPGWLEALERTFETDPSVGIQGGKLLYPDGRIQHAGIVYGPVNAEGLLLHYHLHLLQEGTAPCVNSPREFQMVTGALLAIRRELFDRVGGFDEQYYFGHEDLDLCMKVRDAGSRVWYNPLASAVHFESVTKKLRGIEKFERYISHPGSYDAANDRLFHRKWDGVLEADADRYYRADGLPPPFRQASAPRREDRKLRILMTMFGWTESGGGTTFPRAFAKRLARLGHQVTVFFAAGRHPSVQEPYHLEQFTEDGVTIYGLFNRGSVFLDAEDPEREIHDPQVVRLFRKVVETERPDLVHLHNLLGLSFAVARVAREAGVPVVYTPYNYHLIDPLLYMIDQNLNRWEGIDFFGNSALPRLRPDLNAAYGRRVEAARQMLRRDIDYTFSVSTRVREILVEFGLPADRALVVHQVHATVDELRRSIGPRTKRGLPVRFGYIGGVMPHKGVHLLAHAAQSLPEGVASFAIYGFVADNYRRALEAADPRHALAIHGEYTARDLPAIADAVDVMILPSLWEDCAPFSITESLAMGCPVVAPAIGGFPDFVRDGWNGRLFPAGDVSALATIVREIVGDPLSIDRWAAHTPLRLSFEDHVRHVERLYASMLEGRTLRQPDDDLIFLRESQIEEEMKAAPPLPTGMNRKRLEKGVAGGFSNRDATGKLPNPLPSPLYLNLGCGNDFRRGFVNVDLFNDNPEVVRMDIRRLDLPDASVDGLVAHDVIEHFSHRETDAVVREWARVLKPGAEFMIRCPSLALQCKAYVSGVWDADVASFMIFGGQTNPGDYHTVGFDRRSITRHLTQAGLVVSSVEETDTTQDRGFVNLNMTVKGRKAPLPAGTGLPERPPAKEEVSAVRVVLEGSQFVNHSLALVNRELELGLSSMPDMELSLLPYEPDEFDPASTARFKPLVERINRPLSGPADVHIRHQWPPNLVPPREGRWVVIQPWEFGSLPKEWMTAFASAVDELWVPSTFVRDCYVKSGMPADRVVVVPNGVDTTLYHPDAARFPLATKKRFKFLFVGGTLHRKGIDILLEAYAGAFKRSEDVCLVIKDMGVASFYRGVNAKKLIDAAQARPDAPEIEYIDRTLSPEEMAGLYCACDCLVQPYRGEGFGLPIAEAMACGLPVVVTGAGAALDFCSEATATLIPARFVRLDEKRIGDMATVDYPFLAEPDRDALVHILREVRKNPNATARKAAVARERIVHDFGWDAAALKAAERIRILRTRPVLRETLVVRNAVPPAPVGGGGQLESTMRKILERARGLAMRGSLAEAITFLESAERESAHAGVSLALAWFLVEHREFDRITTLLDRIPREIKATLPWLEIVGWSLEGTGEATLAEECADAILAQEPRSVCGLTLKGKIAAGAGRTVEAERLLRDAMAANPSAATPQAILGALMCGTGSTEEGIDLLEAAFAADPLDGDILVSFVDAARELGLAARLEDALDGAVKRFPASKRLQFFFAEVLAQNGKWNEALQTVLFALAEFGVDDEALAFALRARIERGQQAPAPAAGSPPNLSVCMIVKNEERHLARSLWSVLPLADEIILVDTGSTDRTEEIAAAFGATLFHREWTEDFAAARNASIDQATGQWVFVLDGDEVVSPDDYAAFRALLTAAPPGSTAYSFTTRNYIVPMDFFGWVANDGRSRQEAGSGWIPSPKVRLFPRRGDVRFEFPVHELVDPSLQRCGVPIFESAIPIHHYGKLDPTASRVKAEKYLELGRRKLKEKGSKDLASLMELAFQENDLGHYRESLELYRRVVAINKAIPRAQFGIGMNFVALHRYQDAIAPLRRALGLDKTMKEAYVQLALAHLRLGQVPEALKAAEALDAFGGDYPPGMALLAALRFCSDDRAGGEQVLDRLRSRGLRYADYFQKLGRHLVDEGKPHLAVRVLEPLARDPEVPEDLAMVLVDAYRAVALSAVGNQTAPVLPEA